MERRRRRKGKQEQSEIFHFWFTSQMPFRNWDCTQPKPRAQNQILSATRVRWTQLLELSSAITQGVHYQESWVRNGTRTRVKDPDMVCRHPKWHLSCCTRHQPPDLWQFLYHLLLMTDCQMQKMGRICRFHTHYTDLRREELLYPFWLYKVQSFRVFQNDTDIKSNIKQNYLYSTCQLSWYTWKYWKAELSYPAVF